MLHLLNYPKEVGLTNDDADPKMISQDSMVTSVMRTFLEDLPQCVVQYLFTVQVRKNPMIIFSLIISVLTSFFSLGKAYHDVKNPADKSIYKKCGEEAGG